MTTIIAIANQKGGVGKTTTAVNLAAGAVGLGRRCLVVDLDPQGHAGLALGLEKDADLHRWLVDSVELGAVAVEARPGLDVVRSDKKTEQTKAYIIGRPFGEQVLAKALAQAGPAGYDLVFLDLAPSLDVLHFAALVACHQVIIPTKLDYLAIDGVNEILGSLAEINQHGYDVDYAILPTHFDRVTRETMTQLESLVVTFRERIWPPIPADTRVREAAAYGQTIAEYSPKAPALLGYKSNDGRVGGYVAALERLMAVVDGG